MICARTVTLRLRVSATYCGAAYAWLQQLGHPETVYFPGGESYAKHCFSHIIGNGTRCGFPIRARRSSMDGDHQEIDLHDEAAMSRAVLWCCICNFMKSKS